MAEIFIKKEGSDKNGNYAGFDFGKVIIDFKSEKVYLEVEKQHKDSNDEVITSKGWKSHELPEAPPRRTARRSPPPRRG